jgi:hypothetical protein
VVEQRADAKAEAETAQWVKLKSESKPQAREETTERPGAESEWPKPVELVEEPASAPQM